MNNLQVTGTREHLLMELGILYPSWPDLDAEARSYVGPLNKKEVWIEQAVALAILAAQYDRPSARILEIGASRGYTACIMHLAAPKAQIVTLEPHRGRRAEAREAIQGRLGVNVRPHTSAAWLEHATAEGLKYDMIFVDGDHKHVALDLPFWNLLKRNGLFVFHDYSKPGSKRECPPVYDNLNVFAEEMSLPFDVLVEDDSGVGLAGWYRTDTKWVWPPEGVTLQTGGPWPRWAREGKTTVTETPLSPPDNQSGSDEPTDQDTIDGMREASGTLPESEGNDD